MRALLPLLLLVLCGCRDSPKQVVVKASEAAAAGDLVDLQESFSVSTRQRLKRAWELQNVRPEDGWRDLATKLTFDGKPLEVLAEKIVGEYARVDVQAGALTRDYYLRKEDGRWLIELGAGLRYRQAEAAAEPPAEGDQKAEEQAAKE